MHVKSQLCNKHIPNKTRECEYAAPLQSTLLLFADEFYFFSLATWLFWLESFVTDISGKSAELVGLAANLYFEMKKRKI